MRGSHHRQAEEALEEAGITEADVTALWLSPTAQAFQLVLVGLAAASLAWAHGLPLIPVNYMAGTMVATQSVLEPLELPYLWPCW